MDDKENKEVEQQTEDYAGPPKSHTFTGNILPSEQRAAELLHPETEPVPVLSAEEAQQEEAIQEFIQQNQGPAFIPTNQTVDESQILEEVTPKKISLIDLIAEEDTQEPPKEKKKLEFKLNLDKWRYCVSQARHLPERAPMVFDTLNIIWMVFIAILYAGGMAFFTIFFTIYFAFTPLLKSYLKSKGLSDIAFTVTGHNLSEIMLTNIKDNKGLFKIKSIRLQYNFTDLLKGKITLADIDTLQVFVTDKEKDGFNFLDVSRLFLNLGLLEDRTEFKIQSVQLRNSSVQVGNKSYSLPINFSGIGDLSDKNQFVIPFTFRNDYMTAKATLTTSTKAGQTTWSMLLEDGKLLLDDIPTETVTGTVEWKTNRGKMTQCDAELVSRSESGKEKTFSLTLNTTREQTSIELNATLPYADTRLKPLLFNFSVRDAKIGKDLRTLTTDEPIEVRLSNLDTSLLKSETIQLTLNGKLVCEKVSCHFQMQKPSDIIFFMPSKQLQNAHVRVSYPLRITLLPEENSFISWALSRINFSLTTRNAAFNLTKIVKSDPPIFVPVAMDKAVFTGNYNVFDDEGVLKTEISGLSYKDNSVQIENGDLRAQVSPTGTAIILASPKVSLVGNTLFKPQFTLHLQASEDSFFQMNLKTLNKQLDVDANGYFNLATGEYLAAFQTKPIVFAPGSFDPIDFSSLFSSSIKNVTGTITAKGQIHWRNIRNINGPFNILIDKLSFDYGDVKVKNLSSMLEVNSLAPFGNKRAQTAFIEELNAPLPFKNVDVSFLFDSNQKQFSISKMNLNIADTVFRIDPTWFSYQTDAYSFLFKSKAVDLEKITPYLKTSDLKMTGQGSASMSIQLEGERAQIRNLEALIPLDGTIAYTPKDLSNKNLEAFQDFNFRNATIILTELADKTTDLIFMATNRMAQERRKTTIRFNMPMPLSDVITPMNVEQMPEEISERIAEYNAPPAPTK